MNTKQPSRLADKFVVRLPDGLRAEVQEAADERDTSMNTVVVQAIRRDLDSQNRQKLLLDALAEAEATRRDFTAVRDDQLTSLEQRRYAEQQACQAAERRVKDLEWVLMAIRSKSIDTILIAQIDAALNPTAEAVSPAHVCSGCGVEGWTANCPKCIPY